MPSPIDPESSGIIGWALGGIATGIAALISYLYRRLRRLNEIETGEIVQAEINKQIVPVISELKGRVSNVEKLENRLGAMQTNLEHLTGQMANVHKAVEKTAEEAAKQLTGAMNRLADQRREDKEDQLERLDERLDSLKELIQARVK